MSTKTELTVRPLHPEDWAPVVALDALLTGVHKEAYWRGVLDSYLRDEGCIGLAASVGEEFEGYLFGEVRAFEFGSERCGWIFSLGVQPGNTRQGVASALIGEARQCFKELGVERLRTMVRRTDVPFLTLFRTQGFIGGPFVQLELDMSGEAGNPATGESS